MLSLVTPEMIAREKAKRHLKDFLLYDGRGAWQDAKHLSLLCDKLEAVERGEIKRLMVFMPPRHGKSEIISKKFPAWFLGRNPEKEIIISSYSADLALDFSRIARNTLREHADSFNVNVARDSAAVGRWGLEGTRGGMMAAGVGGPVTGRGADIFLIDDPIKNLQDALSETIRKNTWDWYRSTALTRLAPGGAMVIVMTRWHEDDLAGRLLAAAKNGSGEKWDVIKMPAKAEADDLLGRPLGQWLWLDRFSIQEYEDRKNALGTFIHEALYQQNPGPAEGRIFKRTWWKFYKALPAAFDEIFISFDCAFKETSGSDFVAGQLWGVVGANFFLIERKKERLDFPGTVQALRSMAARYPLARRKLVEDKANGPAVISYMKSEIPGLIAVDPKGGKVVRAHAISPYVESGNVYLPDISIDPTIFDYIEEFAAFPNGAHDDEVDATSQALIHSKSDFKPWVGKINF